MIRVFLDWYYFAGCFSATIAQSQILWRTYLGNFLIFSKNIFKLDHDFYKYKQFDIELKKDAWPFDWKFDFLSWINVKIIFQLSIQVFQKSLFLRNIGNNAKWIMTNFYLGWKDHLNYIIKWDFQKWQFCAFFFCRFSIKIWI